MIISRSSEKYSISIFFANLDTAKSDDRAKKFPLLHSFVLDFKFSGLWRNIASEIKSFDRIF